MALASVLDTMNPNSESDMTDPARERNAATIQYEPPRGPGPALLPGIEGLYVLTAAGVLGRYRPDGRFVEEPSLTQGLRSETAALWRRYRSSDPESIAVGLVTRRTLDKQWQCASLSFSDMALREIYRTSDDHGAPLTSFQKRNRTKSVYRAMELILDTRKASRPEHPRFCPVLVVPECDRDVLSRRYGVDDLDTVNALEVLDLADLSGPDAARHPELSRMVIEMTQSTIAPELRSAPDLMVIDNADPAQDGGWSETALPRYRDPWEDQPDGRLASFNDGDRVPYWLLGWFSPFNELNDLQRQFVARGHTVTKKRAGATLIERGSRDDISVYLIEGTLDLEAYDGRRMSIVGGTRRAHLPVSQLRPHAYTVRAATDVSVIVVSQDMVREVTRITTTYNSGPGIEVSEAELPSAPGCVPDGQSEAP